MELITVDHRVGFYIWSLIVFACVTMHSHTALHLSSQLKPSVGQPRMALPRVQLESMALGKYHSVKVAPGPGFRILAIHMGGKAHLFLSSRLGVEHREQLHR